MIRFSISFLLSCYCITSLAAQDFNNYELLKCEGTIPKDFLIPSTEKYKQEIQKIEKDEKAKSKKTQKQFYLESNFLVDDMLQSGRVLFNDPISKYVNEVAAEVLANEPELKNKLRFYVIRNYSVNAFATNQGVIFVNLGLLAQLDNEAQLAYILAHEIAHVKKQHALNLFLESKGITRKIGERDMVKKSNFDDKMFNKHAFSRELETEADIEGFGFYKKTNYSYATLPDVFDILMYSHLPFENTKFDKSFFETNHLIFPKSYFLDSLQAIKVDTATSDENSTHPNAYKRKQVMLDLAKNEINSNRKNFIISEERFKTVQKIARYETAFDHLHKFQLERAIYIAYLLHKENPENLFPKKIIAKSLYSISKFTNESDYESNETYYEKIQGEGQQVYYLIGKLTPRERTILALRYVWGLVKEYPNDIELASICKDLFYQLVYYHKDLSEFSTAIPNIDSINALVDSSSTKIDSVKAPQEVKFNSKYDKVREKQVEVSTKTTNHDFAFYALGDVIKDNTFINLFSDATKRFAEDKKKIDYENSLEGKRAYSKMMRKRRKRGAQLGIDKIVIMTPYYLSADTRPAYNRVRYIYSEEQQKTLVASLEENAKLLKLDIEMLDVTNLKNTDIQKFNDISNLQTWFSEQAALGDILMDGYNQAAIKDIAKRYGTRYFLRLGVLTIHSPKSYFNKAIGAVLTATLLYSPIGIYLLAKPNHDSLYFALLYDVETGRYETIKYDVVKSKDNKMMRTYQIYDILQQIKSSSKSKSSK